MHSLPLTHTITEERLGVTGATLFIGFLDAPMRNGEGHLKQKRQET